MRAEMFERRSDLVRLLAVADAERIVAAADRLAMTQPALSRILARLEREFGASLFERLPSGIRPTRVGALAIDHARRILREVEDGEEAVTAAIAGRTGRFRVTAPPLWMQAVIAPAVQAFHAAFPEVELKLRTAVWREGVHQLIDGRSDLHCGGIDTGEALPAHLRRERFPDVTAGVVAANGHPLHAAGPQPRDLTSWPWIDFDEPARGEARADLPSLAAILDELRELTGGPARAVLRAGSAGLTLLAAGPWLAWLPLDLLDRLPGTPLRALPLAFGRRRYPTGLIARRSAEDLEPFRMLEAALRDAMPGRSGGTPG
ncbi:MAG: LysR family transcriptional regulator [Rhodospirillaceae bacterium]|nr:LysR family transcriptional regulator [Rhodospirillaceae bacterium]MDE0616040.1 LysR family transcriptional regulator [Rhodospirillaceae bacterium]